MKSAIIVFPGINREQDMAEALTQVGGTAPVMVWHRDSELPAVDLIVVPGGFSYGDYLRAGAMAAQSPIMAEVVRRAKAGTPVLGVCNGFQILTEAGLLPGALMRNASLKFVCRFVQIRAENTQTLFTAGLAQGQVLNVPVAHHDGNYYADAATLAQLQDQDRIAFRYSQADGTTDQTANPNGSLDNIAGIFNREKTVLGMMPHPENAIRDGQPQTDGRAFFASLAKALG